MRRCASTAIVETASRNVTLTQQLRMADGDGAKRERRGVTGRGARRPGTGERQDLPTMASMDGIHLQSLPSSSISLADKEEKNQCEPGTPSHLPVCCVRATNHARGKHAGAPDRRSETGTVGLTHGPDGTTRFPRMAGLKGLEGQRSSGLTGQGVGWVGIAGHPIDV